MPKKEKDAQQTFARAEWIVSAATLRRTPMYVGNKCVRAMVTQSGRDRLNDVTFASGYAEPGYSGEVIAFGNWNEVGSDKIMEKVAKLLEKAGISVEWSDEWTTCVECGKALRTEADSYSWTLAGVHNEGEGSYECEDCVQQDAAGYLESIEGKSRKAVTCGIDPEDHGYVRLGDEDDRDFENGLMGGQDDDPQKIGKALRARGVKRYLFKITGKGQFDVRFAVYVHESEAAKAKEPLKPSEVRGKDPAEGLKAAFADASRAERVATGSGPITIVKCDIDSGTASARKVSREDFVKGER